MIDLNSIPENGSESLSVANALRAVEHFAIAAHDMSVSDRIKFRDDLSGVLMDADILGEEAVENIFNRVEHTLAALEYLDSSASLLDEDDRKRLDGSVGELLTKWKLLSKDSVKNVLGNSANSINQPL